MRTHRVNRLIAIAALLALPLAGACADEDGDGATTDEEIQDVRDGAKDAGDRVEKEVDGQDEGSNDNNSSSTTTGG
ncbi:MAG: hypothetical protein M3Q68_00395 [Actinomycetota bacterium]|nr:hypothetical protein [Actinomycetota bacterium]